MDCKWKHDLNSFHFQVILLLSIDMDFQHINQIRWDQECIDLNIFEHTESLNEYRFFVCTCIRLEENSLIIVGINTSTHALHLNVWHVYV